jgi:hypothetical protein
MVTSAPCDVNLSPQVPMTDSPQTVLLKEKSFKMFYPPEQNGQ